LFIGKCNGRSSSSFSRDRYTVPSGDNLRSESGGISEEKGDIFSVKRKKLHQWVKDTWLTEIPELTSNGHDLVSVLLTRLSPGTEETQVSLIESLSICQLLILINPQHFFFLLSLLGFPRRRRPESKEERLLNLLAQSFLRGPMKAMQKLTTVCIWKGRD
jgi:hypothetical protein